MTDTSDRLAEIRARLTESGEIENKRNNNLAYLLSLVDQLQGQQADEIDRLNALVGMGETHLAKLERMKSQVAALIAAVSGLSIPEGKHSPDYRMGYADALGAARFTLGIAHPPAQDRASGPETPQGHPSEGTSVSGLHARSESGDRRWSLTINDDGTITAAFDANSHTAVPTRERDIADAARPAHYREAAASLRALGHDTAADLLDNAARDLEEGNTTE